MRYCIKEVQMNKLFALPAVLLALSGCAVTAPDIIALSNETKASIAAVGEEKTIAAAKELTRHDLYDPESANFRDMRIGRYVIRGESCGPDCPIVCGEYNAKNIYGGYTGYAGFISGPKTPYSITFSNPVQTNAIYHRVCK